MKIKKHEKNSILLHNITMGYVFTFIFQQLIKCEFRSAAAQENKYFCLL